MSEIITATKSYIFLWFIVDHIIDYIRLDRMINNQITYSAIWIVFVNVRRRENQTTQNFHGNDLQRFSFRFF